LNSTNVIQFNDASQNIGAPSNAILDINATDEIELNATLIDINGNVEISGTATTTGVHTFTAVPVFPNNTVETADIQADAITGAKIADDAINSEHYTDGSIDTAHIAADQIVASLIADDAINSEHYTDGSIDTAHIADKQITPAKIAGSVNAQTGTAYTSVLGDAFKSVTMSNTSANKLTIPPNSGVAYAVGDRIDVVMLNTGVTSIQGGSGVTVNGVSTGTVAIAAQFSAVACLKLATNTWVAIGNHGGVS